ncbi:MAG: hypothetical protein FJ319_12770 [SAR202 cluster bacterium]|nr:hypothetical protein [SAR202 cluster bacterium]
MANFAALVLLKSAENGNRGYWRIGAMWNLLGRMEEPTDWLVLGDSSGFRGFDPAVWQDATGEKAINLSATVQVVSAGYAMLLKGYIERFGAPKAVIVIHTYDAWYREVDTLAVGQTPLWGIWENRSAGLFSIVQSAKILLTKIFPIYYSDTSLPSLVLRPYTIRFTANPLTIATNRARVADNGFEPAPGTETDSVVSDLAGHLRFVSRVAGRNVELSDVNKAALHQLGELSDQYEFDIYLVNGPIHTNLNDDRDFQNHYSKLRQALTEEIGPFKRLHLLPGEPKTFETHQLFNSIDHVTGESAESYTRWLADRVAR